MTVTEVEPRMPGTEPLGALERSGLVWSLRLAIVFVLFCLLLWFWRRFLFPGPRGGRR